MSATDKGVGWDGQPTNTAAPPGEATEGTCEAAWQLPVHSNTMSAPQPSVLWVSRWMDARECIACAYVCSTRKDRGQHSKF